MSLTTKVLADASASVGAPRERSNLWATAFIIGVLAAWAMGAGFYLDAPQIDAWMVAP